MYEHIFSETPEERACRYRQLAQASAEYASHEALPSIQEAYLRSAERWNKLASIMELGAGHEPRKAGKADSLKLPKKARGWTIHKQQSGLKEAAQRSDSAAHAEPGDAKQSQPAIAPPGGAVDRRPVLGRRGVLGRAAAVSVNRARSA